MTVDRDWEKWGRNAPYFGVLSDERFRGQELRGDTRLEFFASGEIHIAQIMARIEALGPGLPALRRSLDFGCGVGRLLIPLAKRSVEAVGIDISPSMLAEAARNCASEGVSNVQLIASTDELAAADGAFDLVHSYIVLQHIPPKRGLALLAKLVECVAADGWLAIQFPYYCRSSWAVRALIRLRYTSPWLNRLRNIALRRPSNDPPMQLHAYDLGMMLPLLRKAGFARWILHADESTSRDFDSVLLLARRSPGRANDQR